MDVQQRSPTKGGDPRPGTKQQTNHAGNSTRSSGGGQQPDAEYAQCASETTDNLFRGSNRLLAEQLINVVMGLEAYWPMTLRQVYYQGVTQLLVQNDHSEYRRIGNIMERLRRAEILPWACIEDRTRTTSDKRGVPNLHAWLREQLEGMLNPAYYKRCYLQEQPVYVEISVEKDALSQIVQNAAWMYCTRVTVTRGQISATALNNMADRFDLAIMNGKEPILLHFGDLDPTGVQIPLSIQNGLLRHHGIRANVRQVALTPAQCVEHNLPQSLDSAKGDDPNFERWRQRFGDHSPTELDALHPKILGDLVEQTLINVYDGGAISEQKRIESQERNRLKEMRLMTMNFLRSTFPTEMRGI